MEAIPKVVGDVLCGFLLCLGLSNAASAADDMKLGGQTDQKDMTMQKQSHTIQGNVVRVEYGDYFVKDESGQEVRLHTDKTTQMMGQIKKGDRVVAKVNDQNHALSIVSAR